MSGVGEKVPKRHTFSVAGGVSLPGNVTYSLRLQNETFLAHTINPAVVDPTLALGAGSAGAG
jgi:hypothetical protein